MINRVCIALGGACVLFAAVLGAFGLIDPLIELWLPMASLLLVGTVLLVVALPRVLRSIHAFELAMEGANDGLFQWNPETKELIVGRRLLGILGYEQGFITDTHVWLDMVHPEDRGNYNAAVAAHLKGLTDHFYCEYRVRRRDGTYRWIAARGVAVRNRKGRATLMAGSVTDITDRIQHENRIRELALSDQLTGLPNRRALMERLPAALAEAGRSGTGVALLFIDLDRFKHVNDSCGHVLGDFLLVEITRRLPAGLRAYDSLVRQGGDELIVMLTGLTDPNEAENVARRLLELISRPVMLDDTEVRVTASIGIAMYPRDAGGADDLLRAADMAMYAAKATGGNEVSFFETRMQEQVGARVTLESRLRVAIENGDMELHFQPQKRFSDGVLCGAEALVRWRDGDRMIPPDQFIPLAEETGLIDPLGLWVVHAAVDHLARWSDRLPDPFRLSINLSPREFLKRSVELDVLAAIARAGVSADRLCLEVTESVLLHPEGDAIRALGLLREAGFQIALDDFGTGYASLSYLQLLDLDCIKIDKSFIANLDLAPTARGARSGAAIVSAMVALGHRLGYEVVAEGVEAADQYEWLRKLGCDVCQGYFFAPPLTGERFGERFLPVTQQPERMVVR